ncbi:NAD(P)H-binding protein [Yaniella flava]|uniref:NAD(P)H-binding protein n=1 Tax=Yaniella flava TaxID=287930 RepID=A0ABN2UYA1_9MICC
MNIVVLGDTGMVGSRTIAEARDRGHTVSGYSRNGQNPLNFADTAKVVELINDPKTDLTIISVVSGRTGSYEDDIANHKALIAAGPTGRMLVVGGAGGLQVDETTQLKDSPDLPESFLAEAQTFATVLDLYRNAESLNWTMLAPAPMIEPGKRTGEYTMGKDYPVGDSISAEDFAVALLDEAENPQHAGTRFTVAN